jgi:spore coat protein U domain-containing protein, fimbrial subunit CupE1/2/3/6
VKYIEVVLVLMAVTWSSEAWAQQCMISTVAINFGVYDVTARNPLNAVGSISVHCSPAILTVVKLDPGRHSAGSFNPRKMMGGGENLQYNLYMDAPCTTIWGDGTGNTFTQTGGNLTVYGRITPLQNVNPGVYSDVVTITVEW